MLKSTQYLILISLVLFCVVSNAASGVTYHGRILRSNSDPVNGQFVGFRMRVMDASGTCQMYEEIQTKDMRTSNGVFSIIIGDGSAVGTYGATGITFFDGLFQNAKTFNFAVGHACEFSPYVAGARDVRKLHVSFRESPGDPWEDMPPMSVEHVPFAFSALSAQKVGNHGDGSLLRVENAGTPSAVGALTPTQYNNLVSLSNGTSTQYVQSVLGTASQITVNTAAGVATVGLADVATAGTYGSATQVPVFTLDAKGRITSVTNTTITGAAPTGAAGGDLTGNFPSPDIAASAVGTAEIANLAVTDAKLAADSVTTGKILNANVTLAKLATDSVDSSKIVDGSITGADVSSTANLSVASVTATGAVTSDSVSTRSIGLFELPVNGTNYVAHKAPDNLAGNTTYTWPAAAPGSNMVLQSDATGNLSWVAASTGSGDFLADGSVPMTGSFKAIAGTVALPGITFVGDLNTGIYQPAADSVSIATNGIARLNVTDTYVNATGSLYFNSLIESTTSTGNTYSPTAATEYPTGIFYNSRNGGNADGNSAYYGFQVYRNGGVSQRAWIGAFSNSSGNTPTMVFGRQTGASTHAESMRIDASGNVGIGTLADPTAKLDVKGNFAISGATSGAVKFAVPAAAGTATYTWPAAAPGSNMILQSDNAGNLSWVADATGGAPGDASYAAKGIVQFDTDAATSGMTVAGGVARIATGGVSTGMLANDAVTFAKIQNITDNRILGRSAGSAGDMQEITVGTGLDLTAGVLTATATAPSDASYAAKGIVQFDTDAATSGITVAGGVAKLATSGVAANTYGSASAVPVIAVDAFGRITSATTTSIAIAASQVTSGVLDVARGGTGTGTLTANRMFIANGTGTALTADTCTVNQVLQYNGTTWVCVATTGFGPANAYVQSGNAFGAKAVLGTTDNNTLEFITNNTAKMTVLSGGNVGVGVANPTSRLDVSTTNSANADATGVNSTVVASPTVAQAVSRENIGFYSATTASGSNAVGKLINFKGYADNWAQNSATTVEEISGMELEAYNSAGNVGLVQGIKVLAQSNPNATYSTATITGVDITANNDSGTTANQYGAKITTTAGDTVTNNYGIYLDHNGVGTVTNNYGIFQNSAAQKNYFAGNVGIGKTNPSEKLDVQGIVAISGSTSGAVKFAVPAVAGSATYTWPAAAPGSNMILQSDNAGNLSWVADATGGAPGDASYAAKGIVQFDTDAATSGITVAGGVAKLATSGVAANTYGSASAVPVIAVDAFGRITSATTTSIAIAASQVTSGVLDVARGGTGTGTLTANRMFIANGTGTALTADTCTVNQVLQYNGTTWVCVATSGFGPANPFVQSGNAFAAKAVLGTTDNNDLEFITNNTAKMLVTAAGDVGIGTSTPQESLHVARSSGSAALSVGIVAGTNNSAKINLITKDGVANTIPTPSAKGWGISATSDSATTAANRNDLSFTFWDGASTTQAIYIDSLTGNIGLASTSPGAKLDVKGDFAISGSTSGAVKFAVPAAAGSATYTWPAAAPASNMVLQSTSAGVLSWVAQSGGGLPAADGSAGTPGINFTSDTNTGIYRVGADTMGFSTGGAARMTLDDYTLSLAIGYGEGIRLNSGGAGYGLVQIASPNGEGGRIRFADGQSSYAWDTAISRPSAGKLLIDNNAGGAANLEVKGTMSIGGTTSGAVTFAVPAAAGSATYTWPAAAPGSNMVLQSTSAGVLSWVAAGGSGDFLANGTVNMTGAFRAAAGTNALPGISFAGDPNTGIYSTGDDYLHFIGNGVTIASLSHNGFNMNTVINGLGASSASAPAYSFTGAGNADTGIFNPATDVIGFSTANAERMRIDSAGNVGIGMTSGGEKLEVSGNVKATAFISTSDRRLKTDIRSIEGLELIRKLNGVRYKWKSDAKDDFGLIAQEVEEVIPDAVVTDKNGYKAVKYSNLVSPLIEATKELDRMCRATDEQLQRIQAQVAKHDRQIASVIEENKKLNEEVKALRERNATFEQRLQILEQKFQNTK